MIVTKKEVFAIVKTGIVDEWDDFQLAVMSLLHDRAFTAWDSTKRAIGKSLGRSPSIAEYKHRQHKLLMELWYRGT